jgi:hypothetical protein
MRMELLTLAAVVLGTALMLASVVAAVVAVPAVLGLAWFRHGRGEPWTRAWTWAVLAMLGLPVLGFAAGAAMAIGWPLADEQLQERTREQDLATLDRNDDPLLAAIESFRDANGRVPQQIRELVPEHLARRPRTGLARWPRFSYRPDGDGGFELDVWLPRGPFDLDGQRRFVHSPDPALDLELGATLRSGDWVYVPD